MDNTNSTLTDSSSASPNCMNGSMRRPSPGPCTPTGAGGRPASLMDHNQSQPHYVVVVVNRDEKGYGMKVSGDNPVYVQSVKEGGAAERAGLHAGDKIIKVNGVNVMQSTHTEVVALIKSSSQVELTVQQRSSGLRNMASPSVHTRPVTTPTSSRITGPQPVDNEKQHQLQLEKEQYYRLMIEKEKHYIDLLRSQIASSPDEKKCLELAKTEKNLQTLQAMLLRSQSEQQSPLLDSSHTFVPLPSPIKHRNTTPSSPNGNSDVPPPLPKRNVHQSRQRVNTETNTLNNKRALSHINGKVPLDINSFNNEINSNIANTVPSPRKRNPPFGPLVLDKSDKPPPLPPRAPHSAPLPQPLDPDAVNSINKQMSYPLVATFATLVNNYSPNPTHHRTKSSPETLMVLGGTDGSRKLSESMNDLRQEEWEGTETPPGTPPPPYPSPQVSRRDRICIPEDEDAIYGDSLADSPDASPFRGNGSTRVLANSSPIHAANPQIAQEPIISMEDDEISDQEINQLKDHGYFKSLSKLWEHLPHLAVFTNYILSNSDPSSLMFYLLTDLYKEGNAKEMRKWAFEIHSCFLVPGAPLRLSNVDENIAREIDDVLTKEFDKEDRLRKIFWKARSRAKEELTRLLAEFQQKRTAGLGTIFGPTDQALAEVYNDKAKETRLYENLFLEKLEPYLEEIEKENFDLKRYYTAAAFTTVLTRIFQIRLATHALDRCPTFVSKEKSFRTKFIGKYSRKLNVFGHQYIAQQYYTVIGCNNCHQIIFGISPQGYQCSVCHINLHRHCVKLYDDSCPGPIIKKDRGIRKFIGMKDNTDHGRIKKTSHFLQMEKERRQMEERDSSFELNESGDVKQGQPVSRSGSDRRPDAVREEGLKPQDSPSTTDSAHDANDKAEVSTPDSTTSLPATGSKRRNNSNINRSESVKEQSEKRKQRRNISDPSHNTTGGDVDLDRQPGLSNTDSGSSSNSSISCNGRLSESPSNSVDTVGQTGAPRGNLDSDSDMDVEAEPWQSLVPPEELRNLPPHEKKRQDVINELFHTEGSHVRNLKVLYKIFYKKMQESQILKPEELNLIFPNIKEMLDIHTEINKAMRRRRKDDPIVKEIGDMLVNMFDDRQGESLKKAAANFCERQQLALEFIKRRRERDSKFDALLSECEKKRQCRRLPLQGILPTEMQRLSKYPLLLERLINSVESNTEEQSQQEELVMLKRAQNLSKEILNYVNDAAKVAHNRHRLEEIQKHLDTSSFERSDLSIAQEFKPLDLTKYKLIIEGGMQLRRPNKPVVPVHILLLEEAVVILHREGDKFLLKCFQSGSSAQPGPLSPIIKMSTLIVRTNAVCKNALFLVNTSTTNSQMYDLMAEDEIKREVSGSLSFRLPQRRKSLEKLHNGKSNPLMRLERRGSLTLAAAFVCEKRRGSLISRWFKHFSDATESHKKREGKRQEAPTDSDDSESVQDLPPSGEIVGRAEAVGGEDSNVTSEGVNEAEDNEKTGSEDHNESTDRESATSPEMVAGGGIQTSKVSAEEWPLIQPSQVNIAVPPVLTAESMLTPLEQIRRKDALVKQALEDKEGLVADMMSIPREHFQHIADMASVDNSTSREPSERILAAIFQVDQLQKAVNQSLNITEYEAVTAKGGKHPVCTSQQPVEEVTSAHLTIPVNLVRDLATSLSTQLTTLLSEVKQIEEERDMLRKELHKMRERIHVDHNLHSPVPFDDSEENIDDSTLQIVTKSDCEEEQS